MLPCLVDSFCGLSKRHCTILRINHWRLYREGGIYHASCGSLRGVSKNMRPSEMHGITPKDGGITSALCWVEALLTQLFGCRLANVKKAPTATGPGMAAPPRAAPASCAHPLHTSEVCLHPFLHASKARSSLPLFSFQKKSLLDFKLPCCPSLC